jgi:hypothetical protein
MEISREGLQCQIQENRGPLRHVTVPGTTRKFVWPSFCLEPRMKKSNDRQTGNFDFIQLQTRRVDEPRAEDGQSAQGLETCGDISHVVRKMVISPVLRLSPWK